VVSNDQRGVLGESGGPPWVDQGFRKGQRRKLETLKIMGRVDRSSWPGGKNVNQDSKVEEQVIVLQYLRPLMNEVENRGSG